MENWILIIQVIMIAGWIIVYFLLKNFLPSYFGEKGKNLATKEDIGEITKTVESIKSKLGQETEVLKSQLSFLYQNRFSIKNAEREALFALHNKISVWIHTILNIDFSDYTIDTYQDLEHLGSLLNKAKFEFDVARDHLTLFMHDQVILDLIKELSKSILVLERNVSSHIITLKTKYDIYRINKETTRPEGQVNLFQQLCDETVDINRRFYKDREGLFDKVHWANVPLVKLIKQRIKTITDEENVNS